MIVVAPFRIEKGQIVGYQLGWKGWGYYACGYYRCEECGKLIYEWMHCFDCLKKEENREKP
jgi:hypothetical protein